MTACTCKYIVSDPHSVFNKKNRYIYIYIYVYKDREKETGRERERGRGRESRPSGCVGRPQIYFVWEVMGSNSGWVMPNTYDGVTLSRS